MKKAIFGQSKEVWEKTKQRMKRELEIEKEIPEHRKIEVEAALYFIECVLKEFEREVR